MDVRVRLWLIVGASLLHAGCGVSAQTRKHIETVNAENRLLEDQIYQLEYELQIACDKIARLEGRSGGAKESTPTFRSDPSCWVMPMS